MYLMTMLQQLMFERQNRSLGISFVPPSSHLAPFPDQQKEPMLQMQSLERLQPLLVQVILINPLLLFLLLNRIKLHAHQQQKQVKLHLQFLILTLLDFSVIATQFHRKYTHLRLLPYVFLLLYQQFHSMSFHLVCNLQEEQHYSHSLLRSNLMQSMRMGCLMENSQALNLHNPKDLKIYLVLKVRLFDVVSYLRECLPHWHNILASMFLYHCRNIAFSRQHKSIWHNLQMLSSS